MAAIDATSVSNSSSNGNSNNAVVDHAAVATVNSDNDIQQERGRSLQAQFGDQSSRLPRRKIITIFLACATVDFVALIDQTTLAVALSTIGSALHSSSQTSWIASGYFITSTSFQLLYGRLSDIWSRKYVLYTGLAIFFIGSLASSLSTSVIQLIVFRAITGIGGGGLMTVAQIIVSDVVSLRERGRYQGILGAVVAISNGIGPLIGAALASTSQDGWRWIFRLNLFTAAFTTTCCHFFMPLRKTRGHWKEKLKAVDFCGVGFALIGSTLLILGLIWGGSHRSWNAPVVISSLTLGFVFSIAFIVWEWKGTKHPLVPMHIFKFRMVNGACLTMAINGWLFLTQIYYIPTFFQLAYGYSAIKAGALLLPLTLVQTFSSTLSGLIVSWRGRYRESILLGWVLWAVGLGLFSTLDKHSNLGKQIGYLILTGFGVGQTLQPSLIAIQAGVRKEDMAVVTATRNFIRNLGGTFGLAVAGTIINSCILNAISSPALGLSPSEINAILNDPSFSGSVLSSNSAAHRVDVSATVLAAYQRGFRIVFIVGAALAALSVLLAAVLMPQIEIKHEKKVKEDEEKGKEDEEKVKEDEEKVKEDEEKVKEDVERS
ncbi:hypothetical protein M430DRAFT_133859 [Amorphotheca resinae ATCC 22711]|uniref:Major facilitator superfamily (MFS) profile domain-containing protein n=1 Tax=Amorphotheca resinae ATCC 22711 TaxID=857342 RepID=A0A2T3BAT0_AMORE|nr:hypothetical protein M430DRAFT_133859 [Amorphotheca resinae ATCC 22711]PSS25431.1 hypothetical protein M430DRAFT_133859 [Amorphotheca resinae ATCC 22711]